MAQYMVWQTYQASGRNLPPHRVQIKVRRVPLSQIKKK